MPIKKIISLSGCHGSGTSELARGVLNQTRNVRLVRNCTNRPARRGSEDEFQHLSLFDLQRQEEAAVVAWKTEYDGYWYWILKPDIEKAIESDRYAIITVAPEAVPILLALAPAQVLPIWVEPPSELEHRRRLRIRGDKPEKVNATLAEAINCRPSPDVEYCTVRNDKELGLTLQQLGKICRAEEMQILPRC